MYIRLLCAPAIFPSTLGDISTLYTCRRLGLGRSISHSQDCPTGPKRLVPFAAPIHKLSKARFGVWASDGPGLINWADFIEIQRIRYPPNFKISDFTVHRFKIFEKNKNM
jgi:hypothetical protein